ncbi:uncharacterized protein LOC110865018 [Helianthus annuus]|uniref:uncharacterized protein LOC110865018 n=1 Tax=Helianthus annuus TaxID=4232 RepID=UPI001652F1BD|nr:uncharacterized protein LOC110865018 [Helianthus annuus]
MVAQGACFLFMRDGRVSNLFLKWFTAYIWSGIRFSRHSDRANTGEAASTWNFLNLEPSIFSRLLLNLFISLCRCSRFAEMMMMGRWFQRKRTHEEIVNLEKKH